MHETVKSLVAGCAKCFYTGEHGELRVNLDDELGDWLYKVVRMLHDGHLPSNWRWFTARRIFDAFAEMCEDADQDATGAEMLKMMENAIPEMVDSFVSPYTGPRWDWFTVDGMVYDAYIVEAIEDGEHNFAEALGIAQARVIEEMARGVLSALTDHYCLQVA